LNEQDETKTLDSYRRGSIRYAIMMHALLTTEVTLWFCICEMGDPEESQGKANESRQKRFKDNTNNKKDDKTRL